MRFPRLRRKGLGLEAKPGPKREEGATAGTLFSLDSHLPARIWPGGHETKGKDLCAR